MQGPLPGHTSDAPHVPVLIDAILRECAPIQGVWLDGTLGAGGYTRALLGAGADRVIGIDRDDSAGRDKVARLDKGIPPAYANDPALERVV